MMVFKKDKLLNGLLHKLFPKKTVYPTFSWDENFLGGHMNIGPITIYGANAMHYAINIKSKRGYICFRLPLRCFGRWWPLYFYVSPDATPSSATFWLYGRRGCC
jgi:hypothetical protein